MKTKQGQEPPKRQLKIELQPGKLGLEFLLPTLIRFRGGGRLLLG